MFTLYWIGFVSARNPYWIGLLCTNSCGGEISVTERRCAPPISKVESVIYRMGVHAPDSLSCQRENLSSIWWCKCITLFEHFFAVTARFSDVKLPNFPFYDNTNLQRPGERLLTTTNLSFSFLNLMFFFRIKLQESSPSLDGVSESFLKWCFRTVEIVVNSLILDTSKRAQLWSQKIQNKQSKTDFMNEYFSYFSSMFTLLGHIPWQTSRKKDFVTCHQVSQWVLWVDWWAEGERGRDYCSPCNSSLLPRARSCALSSFPLPFLTLATQANPRVTTD